MSGNIVVAGEDLGTSDPWEAITTLRQERDRLAVELGDCKDRYRDLVAEANRLRREVAGLVTERSELREALAEAAGHVEPVDQNSELAIARWQALAASPDGSGQDEQA